jgi:DNA-binding response OmpR family regulator
MRMEEHKQHILVVDDDDKLRRLIEKFLKDQGFDVSTAPDAPSMDKRLEREHVDLIVLDRMLPGEDGLSICKRLREKSSTPAILMLTAQAEEEERITGLESGADDYLPKPFNPRELLARIHAILRRTPKDIPGAPEQEVITFQSMTLDLRHRTFTRDNEEIELTSGEFALLKALVTRPFQTLSREQLMHLARGKDFDPNDRTIDTQVSRLRKLIERDPAHPAHIQTVWGKGYVFIPDGDK